MICQSCAFEADMNRPEHGEGACDQPSTCTCQHGFNLEMDPDPGEGHFQGYLDGLPPDDPRRLAYEARVRRTIA